MNLHEEWLERSAQIYVHIPFCARKCLYCDFLSFPSSTEIREQYVAALIRQIRSFADPSDLPVRSVFFGGGTPSLLAGEEIRRLMHALRDTFPFTKRAEISMECNPGTVDERKLADFRSAGISRLSMGLQSMDDEQLRLLGRIHTRETFLESYALARKAGFDNINIDLMYGLPGQNAASWKRTLQETLSLQPQHISAYSLIVEEGTPFYSRYHEADMLRKEGKEQKLLPDEEAEREMDELCRNMLSDQGLMRYEISNYALPGRECIHNIGYWTRKDYIGFGLGAASLWKGIRFRNTIVLADYLQGDFGRKEAAVLSRRDEMEETMFLGLRLSGGVSTEAFEQRFGESAETVYQEQIDQLRAQGLLCIQDGFIRLTARGRDLATPVMAAFL